MNASISNVTQGNAQGGNIEISAGSLTVDSGDLNTDVGITTLTTGQGQAGNINIRVDENVLLRGNGQINAMTLGDGDAGNITIGAKNLTMEETEQTPELMAFVGIQSLSGQESDIDNGPTGSSGDITLNIEEDINLQDGGNIVSITVGDGTAGDIVINANNLTLESDRGRAHNTIGSNTLGPEATGDAGNITLNINDTIQLLGNAFVSTTAISKGNAGDMTVNARSLLMMGNGDEESRSGINSSTVGSNSTGNAGTVIVNVTEDIRMINGANITSDTANNGNAGNIFITANSLYMSANDDSADTGISSSASSERPVTGNAANIFIDVEEAFEMYGEAELKTESESRGDAGSIYIEAGSFVMIGSELESKAEAETVEFRAGNAGDVTINVDGHFEMGDEAAIASDSIRGGAAGNVSITAGSLTMTEYASITSTAGLTPDNAGNINIATTGDINMLNGANIVSDSITAGEAGTINIAATNLNMTGNGLPTRISSTSVQGRGDAGKIFIDVSDTVNMTIGGQITSSTLGGDGNAGEVNVNAQHLIIDAEGQISLDAYYEFIEDELGEDLFDDDFDELPEADDDLFALSALLDIQSGEWLKTGITSRSEFGSRGDAGLITIVADNVTVKNSGEISTSAHSKGDAGAIFIEANNLSLIHDIDSPVRATISSGVENPMAGTAGGIFLSINDSLAISGGVLAVNTDAVAQEEDEERFPGIIFIETGNLVMNNGAVISSSSTGNVAAGEIDILARNNVNLSNARITSSAIRADAGFIEVNSNQMFLTDSVITTSVSEEGNGGDINVSGDFILLDTGFIQGNTGGEDFSGGSINIESSFLIVSNRSLITSSDERQRFVPGSGINVIQAAAPDGVSGDVNIGALEFDLSDELASIGGEVLNLDGLQSNPCDTSSGSSLANVGKGGEPAVAGGFNVVSLEQSDINLRLSGSASNKTLANDRENIASTIDYSNTCAKDNKSPGHHNIQKTTAMNHGAP